MNNHAQDPARAEADLIDLRVQLLAEREGLDKWSAYQNYLSSPDGMRRLAGLRLVQGRYGEEDHLHLLRGGWNSRATSRTIPCACSQGRRSPSGNSPQLCLGTLVLDTYRRSSID